MERVEERRDIPRAEIEWPVTLFDEHDTIEGESRNISAKGLYICCDKPLPLHRVFGISIQPPHHQAIGITGKVIWSNLYGIDDDKSIFGVGVCLIEITEDERHVLNELISNYLELSGDEEVRQMGDEIIKVEPMDAVRKNSGIAESLSGEKTVILGEDKTKCYWNDAEFTEGNMVCDSGVPYKCHMGLWVKQDGEC